MASAFEDMIGSVVPDLFGGSDDDEPSNNTDPSVLPAAPTAKAGRAQQAFDFYVEQGLSPVAASGMVGNLMQESGAQLDPTLIHDGGIGVGIAGWNGSRRKQLRAEAEAAGVGEDDFQAQLRHSWNELNTTERATLAMLKGAQTPQDAAKIALGYFRPSDPRLENRIRNAAQVFAGNFAAAGAGGGAESGNAYAPGGRALGPIRQIIHRDPARQDAIDDQNEDALDEIESANQASQGVIGTGLAHAGASVANTPLTIASFLEMLTGKGLNAVGVQTPNIDAGVAAMEAAKDTNKKTFLQTLMAPPTPTNTAEKVAATLGDNLNPAGPYTLPLTVGGAGLDGVSHLITDANAKSTIAQNAARTEKQAATDRVIKDKIGYLLVGQPVNPNLTDFIPEERNTIEEARKNIAFDGNTQGVKTLKLSDGKFMNVPMAASGSDIETLQNADKAAPGTYPVYDDEATAENARGRMMNTLQPYIDQRKTTVMTQGGPQQTDIGKLMAYGGAAAVATMGLIFAPALVRKFTTNNMAPLIVRDARDTHPDVGVISRPGDYVRSTVDDINAGPLNIMNRAATQAGLAPDQIAEVAKHVNIETRGAAQSLAESALHNGEMNSLNYQFKVPVSLGELNKVDNAETSQYMMALHTLDQFNAWETKNMMQPKTKPVPALIRGQSENDVLNIVRNMEAANPDLRQFGEAYTQNIKALRRFQANGEYGTMPKGTATRLNTTNPHYVPGYDRQIDQPVPIDSATKAAGSYMQSAIRMRLENEARGQYIDLLKDVDLGNGKKLFVQLTPQEVKDNAKWSKNNVTIYRRGQRETYNTDPFLADALKMDPYYFTGGGYNALTLPKRVLEATTTGHLAPWFAVTSFLRNQKLAAVSAPDGMKAPWITQSIAAIPQQLGPQLARSIGESLDNGSGGWLRQTIGDANVDGMSKWLMNQYNKSFYAQMEASGTHYGSILEQQAHGNAMLNSAIAGVEPTTAEVLKAFGKSANAGYQSFIQSVHSAPSFAFARRNADSGLSPSELAFETRRLTGNPMMGGQLNVKAVDGTINPMRFDAGDSRMASVLASMAKGTGTAAEIGRQTMPWFNVSMQGMKRIAEAYTENPAKFIGRAWLYGQMPAAASYLWSAGQGLDPNGRSYRDYMMNGRSDWDRMMNTYIAIPGKPAEQGLRLPRVHELSLAAVMMEDALNHATNSNIFTPTEDFQRAAKNFLGILTPAPPAAGGALIGAMGMVPPQGIFAGQPYSPREEPYNQYGSGLNKSLETFVRAIAPGTADVALKGIIAASSSDGKWEGAKNFVKGAGKAAIEKTYVLRDVLGMQQPMAGNIPIMEEYYTRKRAIDKLLSYYSTWTAEGKDHGPGEMSLKPRSASGGEIMDAIRRPPEISSFAGIKQPEPTNPLYQQFANELFNTFRKDSTSVGGVGFLTAAGDLKRATEQVRKLRNVNIGNYGTWLQQNEDKPDVVDTLNKFKVNMNDPKAVTTFFVQQQQDAARRLLFMIRTAEKNLSDKVGQPVSLESIAPYETFVEKAMRQYQPDQNPPDANSTNSTY